MTLRFLALCMLSMGLTQAMTVDTSSSSSKSIPSTACSLCLEEIRPGEFDLSSSCAHHFHVNCLMQWIETMGRQCPDAACKNRELIMQGICKKLSDGTYLFNETTIADESLGEQLKFIFNPSARTQGENNLSHAANHTPVIDDSDYTTLSDADIQMILKAID